MEGENMILVRYERMHSLARVPTKSTPESTGVDIFAGEDKRLDIGDIKAVSTGLIFDMSKVPAGIDLQIRPRSGLALNHGISVLNSPGTIDRDYRGEIKIILVNHGEFPYVIKAGERIAQLVVGLSYGGELTMVPVEEVAVDTKRGAGGFGSTGK